MEQFPTKAVNSICSQEKPQILHNPTDVHHWSISWGRPFQSITSPPPLFLKSILILSFHLHLEIWSNPGGGEIFRTRPDRPWGPTQPPIQWVPSLSQGVKRPGRDVDHPPGSSAEVEGKVELYLYSPSGHFVACSRVTFTFTFTFSLPARTAWTLA